MYSLQQLLGLAPDSHLGLEAIADNLGGAIGPNVKLHAPAYAAYVVFDYLRRSTWWAEAGFAVSGEEFDKQFDQGAFAELVDLFTSPVWRGRAHAGVRVLGHECSEEPETETPELWRKVQWEAAAVSLSWRLEWHCASGGTLYRVAFADEGFNYDIWLYASAA